MAEKYVTETTQETKRVNYTDMDSFWNGFNTAMAVVVTVVMFLAVVISKGCGQ